MCKYPRNKYRTRSLGVLVAIQLIGAGTALADTPPVTASHVFVNLVQLEDGFEAAEFEFTLTNDGPDALHDLRLNFGVHAPTPLNALGEPILRVDALEPGESKVLYWEIESPGEPAALLEDSDLVGWCEAINGATEEIVRFSLNSLSQGGAQ